MACVLVSNTLVTCMEKILQNKTQIQMPPHAFRLPGQEFCLSSEKDIL